MQWNQKYDYPKSSRTTVDGIRRYLLGETKLPSMITAKKHLQAVVSSGRGARTAPKNYLAYQGAFTPKIKGEFTHQNFQYQLSDTQN